jgi:hypothetical protein
VLKDEDIENDHSCVSQQERDVGFGDYIEAFVFDNKPEKEKTAKMEQDFVNSDPEEEVWISVPLTSLDKENTSHDEEKVFIPEPSTQVSKFVSTFITF